ncbi:MAG: hypothetical protein DMG40_16300 [Acidobacteria bacterium]|nr:MAG: hypothetical protein DMG40_16300 [Acidobacteriota bacterium]
MKKKGNVFNRSSNRRAFFKNSAVVAGAATLGGGLLTDTVSAFAQDDGGFPVTRGDIAILRFLSALEQVEADLWIQYAELGGATDQGLSAIDLVESGRKISTGLAPNYVTALQVLDGDMPQYIVDNTDDEISHHAFLNNYVAFLGAKPVDLSAFAILPPSQVTGVPQNGRLTNLKQLTVDTSWWTRYRSAVQNPDLGGTFENAVPDLASHPHTAIPLNDGDLVLNPDGSIPNHLQAIASTAGFHFGFIEQGGTSLYPSLAQKVTNLQVLRVLLSIGPSETMHFQVWHDKAGNAPNISDGNLTFPNLNANADPNTGLTTVQQGNTQTPAPDLFQTNLIMPEPTIFLNSRFGPVSIIRPTHPNLAAQGAVQSFVDDGLFLQPNGQNSPIVAALMQLAEEADHARRGF